MTNIPFSEIIHLTNVDDLDIGMQEILTTITLSGKKLLHYFKHTNLHEISQELALTQKLTHELLTQTHLDNLQLDIERSYKIVYTKEIFGFNTFFYLLTLGYYPICILAMFQWQFKQYSKFENSLIKNDLNFYFDILHSYGKSYLDASTLKLVFQYYYHRVHDFCYPVDSLDPSEINQSKKERFKHMLTYYNNLTNKQMELFSYNLVSNFPLQYEHYKLVLNLISNIKTNSYLDFLNDE